MADYLLELNIAICHQSFLSFVVIETPKNNAIFHFQLIRKLIKHWIVASSFLLTLLWKIQAKIVSCSFGLKWKKRQGK